MLLERKKIKVVTAGIFPSHFTVKELYLLSISCEIGQSTILIVSGFCPLINYIYIQYLQFQIRSG